MEKKGERWGKVEDERKCINVGVISLEPPGGNVAEKGWRWAGVRE